MNYDVIKLSVDDLDFIFNQLSAHSREFFDYELFLKSLPLPRISFMYEANKNTPNKHNYRESYYLTIIDSRTSILSIEVDPDDGKSPFSFEVPIEIKDGNAVLHRPVYGDNCDARTISVLEKAYSDEMVKDRHVWESFPARFINVNRFISLMTPELVCNIKTEAKKVTPKSPHRAKKKKGVNKVYVYKVYNFKTDWKDITKVHRHNLIACPAWGVRGHYRHYKDGRVVFVKAYVKGKDRENYQGKEYQLFPKESII